MCRDIIIVNATTSAQNALTNVMSSGYNATSREANTRVMTLSLHNGIDSTLP